MLTSTSKVSEIKVSYNPVVKINSYIKSSLDAYTIIKDFFPAETINLQERFVVAYLNRANRVLGVYNVAVGGITGTVADIRLILSVALKTASTSIMLAHNHPSGTLKPSQADIDLTIKLKEAARVMDIKLMDHIIISPEEGRYFSFADEGLF